jgi:hypothetical protein
MRRYAPVGLVLAVLLGLMLTLPASSEPTTGDNGPTREEFVALEDRVTSLEEAVAELRADPPTATPTQAPTETPTQSPTATPTQTPTQSPPQSPTQSPTQTPTEAPTEEPTSAPVPATFPTRDSVGPAVTPTEAYSGSCYFRPARSGEVIDGKVVDCNAVGGVRFAQGVEGVVFRNSIIRGQMLTEGSWAWDDDDTRPTTFTVEDSTIVQSTTDGPQDRAVCCSHYVIERSLIQGTHSGFLAHNQAILIGNYITTDGTDSHSSGGRMLKNSVLRGNTIQCKPVTPGNDGGCSAAAVFYSERIDGTSAAARNLTIEGNYFQRGVTSSGEPGGPWYATRFIDCARRTDCTGITFTGNQLDTGWGTDGGEFPFYADNVWADNYWTDGRPVVSGQRR